MEKCETYVIKNLTLNNQLKNKELIAFCDKQIGPGYYKLSDLQRIEANSTSHGYVSSLLAYTKHDDRLIGVRFTLAPGNWSLEKNIKGFSKTLWPCDPKRVGYFKSLFIDPEFQKAGLGSKLSLCSLEILKKMAALGIVCHSTLNSPNNSSMKYLTKLGFQPIKEHPLFWHGIDYECTHCQKNPCICTAMEMFKVI